PSVFGDRFTDYLALARGIHAFGLPDRVEILDQGRVAPRHRLRRVKILDRQNERMTGDVLLLPISLLELREEGTAIFERNVVFEICLAARAFGFGDFA